MWAALQNARVQRRVGLGVVAAALIALTVVLAGRDAGPDRTSMWISAVSALISVCAFAADLLREPADTAPGPDQRQRATDELAEAVRKQWNPEAGRRRLQDPAPLNVRWTPVGPPLADHRHNVRRHRPLPAPRDGDQRLDRIVETFRELPSGRLVVLGEPGAGKSVLAVRFVLDALAERRPGGPVPVLFALAGWDPDAIGLRAWLAERLATEYRPLAAVRGERTLAQELLDAGLVLAVLDGFDEIPAQAHAEALRCLNSELDERLPVLLTCRTAAWSTAVHDTGDVLTAAEVVELQPLDRATAHDYLENTARPDGRVHPDGRRNATVWTDVLADATPPLHAVLRSPLMVALARTVYGDTSRDPSELNDIVHFPDAGAIEKHLLDAFVPAAFADRTSRWHPEAAHRWLRTLARELPCHGPGVWRLAWWELPAAMPPVPRVLGPALLAVLATATLLVPLAHYGGGVVGDWDSASSSVINFAGILLGLCFGLARILPATASAPQGPRQLARMALTMTAAASVVAVVMGLLVPPLASSRLGAALTPQPAWFLNGCCFGLVLSMMFAVGGLARRPLPLGLPWAGRPDGPRTVRALGGVLVFSGLAVHGYSEAKVAAVTCAVAGLLFFLAGAGAGALRGERAAGPYTSPATVLRAFRDGLLRGFAACTLIGVCAGVVVGVITGAFAAYEIHSADPVPGGTVIQGWRLEETGGDCSVRSTTPRTIVLVSRTALADPFVVNKRARISYDHVIGTSEKPVRIQQRDRQWVTFWDGEPVDAHNLVVDLPHDVEVWLVHRSVGTVVLEAVGPFAGFGLLVGLIGGCASGVYRALSTPSDTIRAAGPRSTLYTDRAATLTRSAVAAFLAGGVCLLLISATGRGSTLGTMHTEVWVQVGTNALALSAWGRLGAARIWLAVTGRAPWRLMGFLAEAHRRGVLRQSGAHYEFSHLLLQQRLAGTAPSAAADDASTAPSSVS